MGSNMLFHTMSAISNVTNPGKTRLDFSVGHAVASHLAEEGMRRGVVFTKPFRFLAFCL